MNYSEAFSPEERLKMRRRWDAESAPLFFYRPLGRPNRICLDLRSNSERLHYGAERLQTLYLRTLSVVAKV